MGRALEEVERAKLIEEYAGELARQRAAAAKRKAQARGEKRGEKQSVSAGNNSGSDNGNGEVRHERAKAAGTNPKYINAADVEGHHKRMGK